MCQWGNTVQVEVTIVASHSHTGMQRRAVKEIDACLAPIVSALDRGGVLMFGSCCGHGERPPEVLLADGRRLVILPLAEEHSPV